MRMSMVTERSAGETTLPKPAIPLGYAGPHNGSKFELTSWSRGTSVAIRTASQCPSQQEGETVMQDGEYTTSQERRTGFIYGYTFIEKPVIYAVIDGQAVFEGDIVLGSAEQLGTADTPVPAPPQPPQPTAGDGRYRPLGAKHVHPICPEDERAELCDVPKRRRLQLSGRDERG